jgi:hypothetical protein
VHYKRKFEFQIAARKRVTSDQIRLPCSPAATRPPQGSNLSSAPTARVLSKVGCDSPSTIHKSRVKSHRILIETPRLESPATPTKQRLRLTFNRGKTRFLCAPSRIAASGLPVRPRNRRELSPLEFLMANLELEFLLSAAKSMKYKFLTANKRGFLRPLGRIALSFTGISSCMPESKLRGSINCSRWKAEMRIGVFRRTPVKVKSLLCYGDSHFQLCKMVTNSPSVRLGEN